jgi:ATP-dependent helicase Lhr and Lhr-like helicase
MQGRWSLTEGLFRGGGAADGPAGARERRRALAELLLERYGIVTREQVLAEGIRGGFAALYDTFCNLETLGVCRRGYFIEGMGGAQFALPGAVERLRAVPFGPSAGRSAAPGARTSAPGTRTAALAAPGDRPRTLVLAAADPAQPYGAALPWPRREPPAPAGGRPARVAGAYVVLVDDRPVLYVERGGRGLLTLGHAPDATAGPARAAAIGSTGAPGPARAAAIGSTGAPGVAPAADPALRQGLVALADAVRAGRVGKLALERIDGRPATGSDLAEALVELGFQHGPRRLTLSA